jgi:hypothetical protein
LACLICPNTPLLSSESVHSRGGRREHVENDAQIAAALLLLLLLLLLL